MNTKLGWMVMAGLLVGGSPTLLVGCEDNSAKASKDSEDEGKKKKKKKDDDEDDDKDDKDAKKAKKGDDGDAEEAKADAKGGDTEAAKAGGDAAAPAGGCGALNEVPAIASGDSKPPTVEEWGKACKVNTQGPNTHPPDCEMAVMREWLKVSCRGTYDHFEKMENFGSEGFDFFQFINGGVVSFTMKLRPGRNQMVRMCKPGGRASLFVSWPSTEAKPLHIALARGDSCES